jgi:hypothetical protein
MKVQDGKKKVGGGKMNNENAIMKMLGAKNELLFGKMKVLDGSWKM